MKKATALLLILCMAIGLFVGCAKTDTQTGAEGGEGAATTPEQTGNTGDKKAKDTITLLISTEPETLDPASANADAITIVLQFIMENLFELNSSGEVVCELAESYDFIDDTTVHFTLKKGVKFSTGTEFTSKDVLWEIERLQAAPKSASHFAFIDLSQSYVEDEYNFVLKFTQAWAPFSNTLSTGRGSMCSQEAFESMGEDAFARAPIGTGPYKLVSWEPGVQIQLTRNEFYWGEPAKTENIIIKFIPESNARVIELETGAADISYYIEGSDIGRVEAIDGYHVEQGDSYRYFVICLSMQEPLFQDERVRYALTEAINKDLLVEASTDGIGTPINGFCPSAMDGYIETEPMAYNMEEAKQLLADAGYPDGFTIDLHVTGETIYTRIAEVVQSMWKEIGVTANIVTSALATYDAEHNGKFQASIRDGTATEISNVLIIYQSSFGSRMNGNDEWLDNKLMELRTYYYGDTKRADCLQEITDYLYEKRYSYPFMVMPTIYAISDKLEGFEFHPAEDHMGNITSWVVYE